MKGALGLRPVFHHREDRIRAHVQLCWLALLLIRVIENAVGDTWRNTRHELDRLHLVTLATDHGRVAQRSALTAGHKSILAALGLPEPARYFDFTTSSWTPRPNRGRTAACSNTTPTGQIWCFRCSTPRFSMIVCPSSAEVRAGGGDRPGTGRGLRPHCYAVLLGLLACTGLRITPDDPVAQPGRDPHDAGDHVPRARRRRARRRRVRRRGGGWSSHEAK